MWEMDKKIDFNSADVLCVMSRLICESFTQNTYVSLIKRTAWPMLGLDKKFLYLMSDEVRVMN
jgi:hypothetical protein